MTTTTTTDYIFVYPSGRLCWTWLRDAPVGFKVRLREGQNNAYNMAKRHGRTIKIQNQPDGDYEITVLV